MNKTYTPTLNPFAQSLRREMSTEENRLWYRFLKTLPCTVNRQKIFGRYIADFYIASANLVIELDGSQHFTPEGHTCDEARTAAIETYGVAVLRFTNRDINRSFPAVCSQINSVVEERLER